jgi:hypothetical protein
MSNPYETPQSNIEVNLSISKTKWKVFFWVVFFLEVLSLVSLFVDPEESILSIIFELIIYGSIIIGIFGFAYDKKIFFIQFWILLIPAAFIYDIYIFTTGDWGLEDLAIESIFEMYLVFGGMLAIILPLMFFQYLALYKYCFKSPQIWDQ